jgi:hypothetical protein
VRGSGDKARGQNNMRESQRWSCSVQVRFV